MENENKEKKEKTILNDEQLKNVDNNNFLVIIKVPHTLASEYYNEYIPLYIDSFFQHATLHLGMLPR